LFNCSVVVKLKEINEIIKNYDLYDKDSDERYYYIIQDTNAKNDRFIEWIHEIDFEQDLYKMYGGINDVCVDININNMHMLSIPTILTHFKLIEEQSDEDLSKCEDQNQNNNEEKATCG